MRPYLDFTVLARLLFNERASRLAVDTLSRFQPPFHLNGPPILQVENFFRPAAVQNPRAVPLVKRGEATHLPSFDKCQRAFAAKRGFTIFPEVIT